MRNTKVIKIGNLYIGGDNPVIIQGMTKVPTSNLHLMRNQIKRMINYGAEIIRFSILNEKDTDSIPILKKEFKIPFIADIHYNWYLAKISIEKGIDKIRINPGNIDKKYIKEIIKIAKEYNVPIRIGLNSGSVKIKEDIVSSLIETAKNIVDFFQDNDFFSIVISLKTPYVKETIECYRKISEIYKYPLHIGITEAGSGYLAISKSILGIGILLNEGIGDTIRVSLTAPPEEEIKVAKSILQALNLRTFEPEIISCPMCGRMKVNLKDILEDVKKEIGKIEKDNPEIRRLKIAVMGCSVNGPGEAKQADIGIAGGDKKWVLFKKGKIIGTYPEEKIIEKLLENLFSLFPTS
ncbi:MAG: flavodoxin-dependent (E)-4-hydroxy-3-methylbut-2-enyl-diphosphate synthase [Candidatus Omnitrophica bacterium]|nr:flavodoxin-dependent (E)-4-hydroxy-3-methylbut-2-enyl-diphosphate synthase [Candidatus Omnitrophota bacterium]MCM8802523.1 flavodoxin-dependent (E)-4-hydroxy-3-methylbut-2-enyl-diphosphate synthase [Candidatus Omnitrophota bacterium]